VGDPTGPLDRALRRVKNQYPSLLDDPERALLYGYMPRDAFVALWLGKLREVIDQYQPDLIWFDSWLDEIPERARQEFLAYYYNDAARRGREVVVTRKQDDLPMECSLVDYEKGRAAELTENVWLTDDTISQGSWCWTRDLTIKDPDEVIDTLIDIVSKNGQLLLNISPMADGTIPRGPADVLHALGDWLQANGEAIYETRPWLTYGEGPTPHGTRRAFRGQRPLRRARHPLYAQQGRPDGLRRRTREPGWRDHSAAAGSVGHGARPARCAHWPLPVAATSSRRPRKPGAPCRRWKRRPRGAPPRGRGRPLARSPVPRGSLPRGGDFQSPSPGSRRGGPFRRWPRSNKRCSSA
jgi:hypothetical protein